MTDAFGLYGDPPAALVDAPADALQLSPLTPGSTALEALEPGVLSGASVLAPPGVLERRYVLAHVLRALAPGAPFTAMAPKDKGGSRLGAELKAFGCEVEESGRRHHRIIQAMRPQAPTGLEAAIAAGGPQIAPGLGLWSQPGVFSWDRPDPGSARLAARVGALAGEGADLGCGVGLLALSVLASPRVEALALVDLDRRAVEAARRNVTDPRASFHWADAAAGEPPLTGLDFVVMNPPFHLAGAEDRGLGQVLIRRAAAMLRKGGRLYMVANRHLPYEAPLAAAFKTVNGEDAGGFKLFEAVR